MNGLAGAMSDRSVVSIDSVVSAYHFHHDEFIRVEESIMKKLPLLLLTMTLGVSSTALAGPRGEAILGGALGGALGAAIGSELGGREGAIIGGAIGGATGTALTTQRYQRPRSEVVYVDRYVDRPVYYGPRDYGPPPYPPGLRRGHYKYQDYAGPPQGYYRYHHHYR